MKKSPRLVRTERGYAGHFICSHYCRFRRNTLLEYGEIRVVVSTVGDMHLKEDAPIKEIGCNRFYETMVFHAQWEEPYWEANVQREICFKSNWCIQTADRGSDKLADEMHEKVVREISQYLKNQINL